MTNIFLIRPKGKLLNFGSKFLSQWFLKANVTILDLSCTLPGSGIPEPGAVPGIPGAACSEHEYLSQVEVISCRVSSSILELWF